MPVTVTHCFSLLHGIPSHEYAAVYLYTLQHIHIKNDGHLLLMDTFCYFSFLSSLNILAHSECMQAFYCRGVDLGVKLLGHRARFSRDFQFTFPAALHVVPLTAECPVSTCWERGKTGSCDDSRCVPQWLCGWMVS